MKTSARYWSVVMLLAAMAVLEGCVVYPQRVGHAYGHDHRYRPAGRPYYGYGEYREHGRGHHHHHHDDD